MDAAGEALDVREGVCGVATVLFTCCVVIVSALSRSSFRVEEEEVASCACKGDSGDRRSSMAALLGFKSKLLQGKSNNKNAF